MKNKGQVLVLFLLLLPIMLMLIGLATDYGNNTLVKLESESSIKRVLKTALKEDLDQTKITELLKDNLNHASMIEVTVTDRIDVRVKLETKTLFSHLLGVSKEQYQLVYQAYKVEDKIRIVKG